MNAHAKVGYRCRIPAGTLMDDVAIDQPGEAFRPPINGITMEIGRGVEAEINRRRRTSVTESHSSPVVTGVEIDVYQHSPWIDSSELDVDLLQRRVAV